MEKLDKATIVFKDGTELEANVNASTLILDEKPIFPRDLSIVKVIINNNEKIYHFAKVVDCATIDGKYNFYFSEQNEIERQIFEIQMAIAELAEV